MHLLIMLKGSDGLLLESFSYLGLNLSSKFIFRSNDKHELELDFKRYWEDFRSSSSEKVNVV